MTPRLAYLRGVVVPGSTMYACIAPAPSRCSFLIPPPKLLTLTSPLYHLAPRMPLRQATFSDHAVIAELCCAAFYDEDLFGRVMHPYREQYPNDPALFWLAFLRNHWCDWRNKFLVAVTRDEKHLGKERIVGIAIWQRQGERGRRMALSKVDPRE